MMTICWIGERLKTQYKCIREKWQVNRTNSAIMLEENLSMADALVERDALKKGNLFIERWQAPDKSNLIVLAGQR